jgi:hypothetical protein
LLSRRIQQIQLRDALPCLGLSRRSNVDDGREEVDFGWEARITVPAENVSKTIEASELASIPGEVGRGADGLA